MDLELEKVAEMEIRLLFDQIVYLNKGYRNLRINMKVGENAEDFVLKGQLFKACEKCKEEICGRNEINLDAIEKGGFGRRVELTRIEAELEKMEKGNCTGNRKYREYFIMDYYTICLEYSSLGKKMREKEERWGDIGKNELEKEGEEKEGEEKEGEKNKNDGEQDGKEGENMEEEMRKRKLNTSSTSEIVSLNLYGANLPFDKESLLKQLAELGPEFSTQLSEMVSGRSVNMSLKIKKE